MLTSDASRERVRRGADQRPRRKEDTALSGITEIEAAAERIAGHVARTPTVPGRGLSALLGVPVTAELELLQRTGSVKARGATAKLLSLAEAERAAGVVAVSGGNHGMAVAVMAATLDVKTTVVMPRRRRLGTSRVPGRAYRVVFGAAGDPRTLAVTRSSRVGADPVAVWRDDVEPGPARRAGHRRIGEIRATTYRGREAAGMEWVVRDDGARVRTFGHGYLLGGGRGFLLRRTTPAGDWDDRANERALAAFLATFREEQG